jgi:DNA-directed RNA polymerases I and III subunit RPAC2
MSVNEVKLQKAKEAFVIRGTGPPSSRTFCIGDEDHTLGNALRHILISNSDVGFAGYSVPHPAEPVVQIRIQTSNKTALEALKTSCQTLMDQCNVVLEKLEDIMPHVRDDRVKMEAKLLEEGLDEGDDEEEGDEMDDGDVMDIKMEG